MPMVVKPRQICEAAGRRAFWTLQRAERSSVKRRRRRTKEKGKRAAPSSSGADATPNTTVATVMDTLDAGATTSADAAMGIALCSGPPIHKRELTD